MTPRVHLWAELHEVCQKKFSKNKVYRKSPIEIGIKVGRRGTERCISAYFEVISGMCSLLHVRKFRPINYTECNLQAVVAQADDVRPVRLY